MKNVQFEDFVGLSTLIVAVLDKGQGQIRYLGQILYLSHVMVPVILI